MKDHRNTAEIPLSGFLAGIVAWKLEPVIAALPRVVGDLSLIIALRGSRTALCVGLGTGALVAAASTLLRARRIDATLHRAYAGPIASGLGW